MTKASKQSKKFVAAAREVGASEDPLEFERVLRGIAKAPPTKKVQASKKPKSKK